MARSGSAPKLTPKTNGQRRLQGMMLELEEEDKDRLSALVERYQGRVGPAFEVTKVFVIRQLLRHGEQVTTLPPLRKDDPVKRKKKPDELRRHRGMVVELEDSDRARLDKLIKRYKKEIPSGARITKAFVIRQFIRHIAAGSSLPALRG